MSSRRVLMKNGRPSMVTVPVRPRESIECRIFTLREHNIWMSYRASSGKISIVYVHYDLYLCVYHPTLKAKYCIK